MTLPDERYRAIAATRQFLRDLCIPARSKRVPKLIRQQALGLLRHYPSDWDLQQLEHAAPDILQQRMEPLHRMVAAYSQDTAADDHEGSTPD